MKSRFMIENPASIEATLKVTMTIKQWTELRDQLTSAWPSWKFGQAINELLSAALKVYYTEQEVQP